MPTCLRGHASAAVTGALILTLLACLVGDGLILRTSDDGARVFVNGVQVLDGWRKQGTTTYSATVSLTARSHLLVVEFYEWQFGANTSSSYS